MNYEHMKVFYVVAKNENISKAAAELDLTQPAVSRIISNIEEFFDIKLFTRSKFGVKLTREGLNLYEMIKNPLNELEKIEMNLRSAASLQDLTINIGATTNSLYCYLFKELDELKKHFKDVTFRIYTGSSAKLLEMVNNNSIDFAFVTTPYKEKGDVEMINVHQLNDILIAPASYKEKIKGRVSIKEIASYPFVLLNDSMQFRELIEEYFLSNGIKINPAYEADSSSILVPLVENECGLSFIPEQMAEKSLKENKIIKVDLIEKFPKREVSFAFKKASNHASVIYEIRDFILRKKR